MDEQQSKMLKDDTRGTRVVCFILMIILIGSIYFQHKIIGISRGFIQCIQCNAQISDYCNDEFIHNHINATSLVSGPVEKKSSLGMSRDVLK